MTEHQFFRDSFIAFSDGLKNFLVLLIVCVDDFGAGVDMAIPVDAKPHVLNEVRKDTFAAVRINHFMEVVVERDPGFVFVSDTFLLHFSMQRIQFSSNGGIMAPGKKPRCV